MTYEQITKFLSYAGVAPYSGRGMYGRICPGVVHDNVQDVLADIVERADDRGVAEWLVRNARWDNAGMDVVVYWPAAQRASAA